MNVQQVGSSWRTYFLQQQQQAICSSLNSCLAETHNDTPQGPFEKGLLQLMRRSGILFASNDVYDLLTSMLEDFIEKVLDTSAAFSWHLIRGDDGDYLEAFSVSLALKYMKRTVFGFPIREVGIRYYRRHPWGAVVRKRKRENSDEDNDTELLFSDVEDAESMDISSNILKNERMSYEEYIEWESNFDPDNHVYISPSEESDDDYEEIEESEEEEERIADEQDIAQEKLIQSLVDKIEREKKEIAKDPEHYDYFPLKRIEKNIAVGYKDEYSEKNEEYRQNAQWEAFKSIRDIQQSVVPLLPAPLFQQLIQKLNTSRFDNNFFGITQAAYQMIQIASERYLIDIMQSANRIAVTRKCPSFMVTVEDLRLACHFRNGCIDS